MESIRNTHRKAWFVIASGLVLMILLGLLDRLSGEQLSLSIFYVLPISWITWNTNRRIGLMAAFVGAAIWFTAALGPNYLYSNPLILYWNTGVKLAFFLLIVFLESGLKSLNLGLESKIAKKTRRLAAEIEERKKAEQRLKVLREIDQALLSPQPVEATVQSVANSLLKLLPCQYTRITLLDGLSSEPLTAGNPPGAGGYGSWLEVPVQANGESLGMIDLLACQASVFSLEYVEIAQGAAGQLGARIQQMQLLDQLRANREDLQTLSQKLLEVQEKERREIARELHDEIGQQLTGLRYMLEMADRRPAGSENQLLRQAGEITASLMERVSQLSLELRPALLDDLGILPTLLWYFARYSAQTGINVRLKHMGMEGFRFAHAVETAAYRIVQEALTNVARHAGVEEVEVTLWADPGALRIRVEDRGRGFDPQTVLASGNSSGLAGMRERALLLGGTLTLESSLNGGACLLAELPLAEVPTPVSGEPR